MYPYLFILNCFPNNPSILPSISRFMVISPLYPHQFLLLFTPVLSTSLSLSASLTHISSPASPPQGVVPAAEPAHGCSAGLHLRRAAGPQPRRRLDGPGHAVRVLQPAARRHQVLHQRHTQQGLHQHHRAGPPHQMPAGGWRFKADCLDAASV